MVQDTESVFVRDSETTWISNEICKFGDKFLVFIKELPDKSFEMAYCDENGNILKDSPRVISLPGQTDARCIVHV